MKKIFILVIIIISITVGLFLSFGNSYLALFETYNSLEKNMEINGYALTMEFGDEILVMDYSSVSDYTINVVSDDANFKLTCNDNSSFEYSDGSDLDKASDSWNYHYRNVTDVDFNSGANDLCQQFYAGISQEYDDALSQLKYHDKVRSTPFNYIGTYITTSEGGTTLGEVKINRSGTKFEIWNDYVEIEVVVRP